MTERSRKRSGVVTLRNHAGRAPSVSDLPRTKARNRGGRCYEIACKALLGLRVDTAWRLVHGIVTGPGGIRMGHAWLATRDRVWDPVVDEFFEADDYLALGDAEVVAEYNWLEAGEEMRRTKSLGPWMRPPAGTVGADP